jgi:hypothetical protein
MLAPVRPRLVTHASRGALPAAVCALAAHVAAYRTLWPKDGMHGYLGWYEPLVAGLSLAAVAGLLVLLAFVLVARRHGRRFHLPGTPISHRPLSARIGGMASSGLAYLIVQESLERSVAAGTLQLASLTPSQWLVVFVGLGSAALVLALAIQVGETAVGSVLRDARVPAEGQTAPAWSVIVAELLRSRPLALRSALRAPPVLSQA